MCHLESNLFIVGFVCDFFGCRFFRGVRRQWRPASISTVVKEIRLHWLRMFSRCTCRASSVLISPDMLGLYVGNIKKINGPKGGRAELKLTGGSLGGCGFNDAYFSPFVH